MKLSHRMCRIEKFLYFYSLMKFLEKKSERAFIRKKMLKIMKNRITGGLFFVYEHSRWQIFEQNNYFDRP